MSTRIKLGSAQAIPDEDFRVFHLDAIDIIVYRIAGAFYGVSTYCPHAGVNLSRGPLDGTVITCSGHGLRFDVTTGRCLDRADLSLTRFAIEVIDEQLYVII